MKIAIYSQSSEKQTIKVVKELLSLAKLHDIEFYIENSFYKLL